MTKKETNQPQVHTEPSPLDEAHVKAAKEAEAKRAGADFLPEPDSEDTLDDLFNDMPV